MAKFFKSKSNDRDLLNLDTIENLWSEDRPQTNNNPANFLIKAGSTSGGSWQLNYANKDLRDEEFGMITSELCDNGGSNG